MSSGTRTVVSFVIFITLTLIQPSLEDSLGFVPAFSAFPSCQYLVLRGAENGIGALRPALRSRVDTQQGLHGLLSVVARTAKNEDKRTHEHAQAPTRIGSARTLQKIKDQKKHEDQKTTLLGSPSLRLLHDQLVPDKDQLHNAGKSQTLEGLHTTVDMMKNPEKAAEETNDWKVLGSRRAAWLVTQIQNSLQSVASVVGNGGKEDEDQEVAPPVQGKASTVASPVASKTAAAPVKKSGNYKFKDQSVNVGVKKMFAVASDFLHYTDWCGDGIQSIKIVKEEGDTTTLAYKAGAFGYMFDFVLAFQKHAHDRVSFKMLEGGSIKRLEGEYRFEPTGVASTHVHFECCAELPGFVPGFVQNAIGNLIMSIAVGELCKYCESPKSAHVVA